MGEGEQQPAEPVPAYSWYALGILFLVYLLNFVDRQILSILANDIRADLGIDDAQLGFLYGTAFAIFYALFGIPLGRLADGSSRVRLLAIGLTLWSVMTVLSGFAKNLATLTLARIGVGVGEASANPCAYSLISDWFPARIRGTAIAIYSAGLFVGSGLSLVLGGAIVEAWNAAFPGNAPLGLAGWQAAFLAVGLPGLLLALWVLTLREPLRGGSDGATTGDKLLGWREFGIQLLAIVPPFTLVAAMRRGGTALVVNVIAGVVLALLAVGATSLFGNGQQFWLIAIGFYAVFSWAGTLRSQDRETFALTWRSAAFMGIVLAYACESYVGYAVTYWAAPYAERTFAFGKAELGWLIGAPNALGGFIGVLGGGWLADRLARRFAAGRAMVLALALIAPIPLVLAGYSTPSGTVFLLCNFLTQVATSASLGASAAACLALVRPRMRGVATAIFLLGATLIGLGFGPFAVGYVSEASGSLAQGVQFALLAAIPGLVALAVTLRAYPAALARAATP